MREASARREKLCLNEDELAFYDALETNDSAVKVLGDDTLRTIAQELVETVRRNATIGLDGAGQHQGWDAERGKAGAEEARVPARQAGQGRGYGNRTGGVAVGGMGERLNQKGTAIATTKMLTTTRGWTLTEEQQESAKHESEG